MMFNQIKIINFVKVKQEIFIGLLVGFGFVLLNMMIPSIAIGFPILPYASVIDKYAIVSVIAPIFEEIAFRLILLVILFKLLKNIWVAIGLQAVIFSIFHYLAYGASLTAMSASFIGALLFGLLVGFICYKSEYSVVSPIVIHMVFNTYLVSKVMFVISGGFLG